MGDGPNDRGLSRKHIVESCDKSLKRLGTDYLDIYFCHRFDPETPVEETVRAMDRLVRCGKVLYWGTSCWTAEQLTDAVAICDRLGLCRPIVEQPRYNLIDRDIERDGVRDAAQELGMGLVVWSPLAQGMLSGKYNGGVPNDSRGGTSAWLDRVITDENVQKVRELSSLAAERGTTAAALSLAWLTHQPGITSVITGATKVEQVEANLAAAQLELDATTLEAVAALFPHPAETE
jgi:aryl-alcohol dehydrogenase-like predicted oxidoreductase